MHSAMNPQAAFEAAQKHCQSLRKISSHHEHQSPGLHWHWRSGVIKGEELLRQIASAKWTGDYTRTAIAVHNREQAIVLQHATAA
jgi:hypothetical protein